MKEVWKGNFKQFERKKKSVGRKCWREKILGRRKIERTTQKEDNVKEPKKNN